MYNHSKSKWPYILIKVNGSEDFIALPTQPSRTVPFEIFLHVRNLPITGAAQSYSYQVL